MVLHVRQGKGKKDRLGLSCNAAGKLDGSPTAQWVSCRRGFFLPVRVLSRVFRGKYLDGLRKAYAAGGLRFYGKLAGVAGAAAFHCFLKPLYRKEWVVYSKPPFGGAEQVLKYLARYTHRVAISNHRLVKLEASRVTFRYKDYADGGREKEITLEATEFLRRFVQHILPKGYTKIRHYGLLANRFRNERLTLSRRLLLGAGLAKAMPASPAPLTLDEPAIREPCCERCGSRRLECTGLPPKRVNTS